jgi:hypothetical protein
MSGTGHPAVHPEGRSAKLQGGLCRKTSANSSSSEMPLVGLMLKVVFVPFGVLLKA